ncbi:hypothetical protein [Bradyrhizobium sp. USDA 4350]
MKPQEGEFWIVEAFGRTTIAECKMIDGGASWRWRLFDGAHVNPAHPDFRAVRKIDIAALLDQPAPVAWRWKFAGDRTWTVGVKQPEPAQRMIAEPLYAGHPPARPFPTAAGDVAEELRGLYRMLWLVVKSAGAPGGVTIDREALESFNPMTAELHSSTHPVSGEIHVEARGGK